MNAVNRILESATGPGRWYVLSAICALGLALYGYTLNFPFVFDDYIYLVDNPMMKDIRSLVWKGDFVRFANESKGLGLDPDLSTNLILRPFAYLTFYVNFIVDGMTPRGFRAVNIVVHCANAMLLFLLLAQVMLKSRKVGLTEMRSVGLIALSASLLFLVHPLQEESVTYIIQRFTSLGSLFYLLTLYAYLKAGAAETLASARWWRMASVASLLIGMMTKEFLFTAPFAIMFLDWMVMGMPLKVVFRRVVPHLCCLPLIPVMILFTAAAQSGGSTVSAAFNITNGSGYPQFCYAVTQVCVLVTYLGLILVPIGQNIDWDYPLCSSLLQVPVVLSGMVLIGIIGMAGYWYWRRGRDLRVALLCYAVLWFFLTISVDSSIIPVTDLMAEHRTYLPSIGCFVALACCVDLLRERWRKGACWMPVFMGAWIVALMIATVMRHEVWRTEINMWRDASEKSPHKARPFQNLGVAYFEKGRLEESAESSRTATLLAPYALVGYRNLGRVENVRGRYREALEALLVATSLAPDDYVSLYELGLAYEGLGDTEHGKVVVLRAIQIAPDYRPARLLMGILYFKLQRFNEALEQLKIAEAMAPLNSVQRSFVAHLATEIKRKSAR